VIPTVFYGRAYALFGFFNAGIRKAYNIQLRKAVRDIDLDFNRVGMNAKVGRT